MISYLTAFFKYLILFFLSRFFRCAFSFYSLLFRLDFCPFLYKKPPFLRFFNIQKVPPVSHSGETFLSLFYLFKLYESIPSFTRSRFPAPLRRYPAFSNTLPLFSPLCLRDRFRRSSLRRCTTLRF